MKNTPKKIIVHHDGVSRQDDSFDVVNQYHKEKGFPISSLGFYVGYHYLIEKTGAIRQAREEDEEGAHTVGQNTSSIGIMLAGNFDQERPTNAQIDSLGVLLSNLTKQYDIHESQIFPHRAFSKKTCYGSLLEDNWAQKVHKMQALKLLANEYLTSCQILESILKH